MPSYPSVAVVLSALEPLVEPPKAKDAVCIPAPAKPTLAVLKSPLSLQEVPLYSSVRLTVGSLPPAESAAV